MNLILLGGNSLSNKPWIEDVQKNLAGLFAGTKILYYDHWKSGAPMINLLVELPKLVSLTEGFSPYTVFAKSFGVMLTLKAVFENKIKPEKCVFCGTSVLDAWKVRFAVDQWIENYALPSLFIEKTADPTMPADRLKKYLSDHHVQNYQCVEIPGDDHKYDNLEEIKSLVVTFL